MSKQSNKVPTKTDLEKILDKASEYSRWASVCRLTSAVGALMWVTGSGTLLTPIGAFVCVLSVLLTLEACVRHHACVVSAVILAKE